MFTAQKDLRTFNDLPPKRVVLFMSSRKAEDIVAGRRVGADWLIFLCQFPYFLRKKENIGHILLRIFGKMWALQRLYRSKKCKLLRKCRSEKWEYYLLFKIDWPVDGSFYSQGSFTQVKSPMNFHGGFYPSKISHEFSWGILPEWKYPRL